MEIIQNPDRMELAMAYVPWQRWGGLYSPCEALSKGTMFACLYKPFKGGCR